ncbi:tight adherence pilus pseudopilin TadF [Endozoicomonas sp.]|uniref:tight adherence pilus pseudopilin TadF n=1 Tax=Endozoicomonas sp. TaxID=1892382 RepID=UPI0028857F43|nr:tight adherence pilus pseudopilin TadF [Endozoicomonas sp.]
MANHRSDVFNRQKQQGVFAVEFALVGSIIALFLMFLSDIVVKENTLGHLQRLSYSGVNVIKERTQLYDESGEIVDKQVTQLYTLLSNSLRRTMSSFEPGSFGMHLEQVIFTDADCEGSSPCLKEDANEFHKGLQGCASTSSLANMTELYLETSWGRAPTLYQVTLCYDGQNWYGDLIDKDFSLIRASSVMLGR